MYTKTPQTTDRTPPTLASKGAAYESLDALEQQLMSRRRGQHAGVKPHFIQTGPQPVLASTSRGRGRGRRRSGRRVSAPARQAAQAPPAPCFSDITITRRARGGRIGGRRGVRRSSRRGVDRDTNRTSP